MEKLRSLKLNILFHLSVNIMVVIFITGASYYHTPLDGFNDKAIYLLHLFLLQSTIAGFIYFLSLSKWIFRIIFSLLFLAYCCFSFWSYSLDISVTPDLIQAVFESKSDIVVDVITLPYILFFVFAVIALFFILKFHSKIDSRRGIFIFSIFAFLCIALYFFVENKRYGTLKNRLPYNVYYALKDYYKNPEIQLNTNVKNLKTTKDSLKVIFVLGETVRADHLSINGYHRNTTPLLEKENVISFTKLHTDHTYTGKSVPQILTDQNLGDEDMPITSIFTVANAANIKTTWIGNQTLEKSFATITNTNSNVLLVDRFKSEFSFNKKLDESMLDPLDSILKTNYKTQLVTLHMIGSHWWYENRYRADFRKFTPVIDSKYVPSQSSEQMINSYDNTILYLDYFLSEIIQKLKNEKGPTALVYVSDHGELLGEDGRWLHAQGGDVLKNPAYLFWFSDSYKTKYINEVNSLSKIKDTTITTNDIYHRLINILGITL